MPQLDRLAPDGATQEPIFTPFIDGVALWIEPRTGKNPASAVIRAGALRLDLIREGLKPGRIYQDAGRLAHHAPPQGSPPEHDQGAGLLVSLAPAWGDLDGLQRVLEIAARSGATLDRLELAQDALGQDPAEVAAHFPSLSNPELSASGDLFTLKQRARRFEPTPEPRWHNEPGQAASYIGHQAAPVSLAQYSSRPSKLDPTGPKVFHVEARARGNRIPEELRDPGNLAQLFEPEAFNKALETFIVRHEAKTLSSKKSGLPDSRNAGARVCQVLTKLGAKSGAVCLPVPRIAQLAKCSESSVYRALRALSASGELVQNRHLGGRGLVALRDVSALENSNQLISTFLRRERTHQNQRAAKRESRAEV